MPRALIGLGSNLGNRALLLDEAVKLLRALPETSVEGQSKWHGTAPVGGPAGQGEFLNGALLLETSLGAEKLHQALGAIENQLGRQRGERWGPRTLDLDLLLYDDATIDTARLVVPHPRMAFRRFVLEPAAEVAPDMRHPVIGWSIAQLLEHLHAAVPYVAIAGPPGVGKRRLAEALSIAQQGLYLADPLDSLDASGPSEHSSGPTLATEIELLDRRAALLDAEKWPNPLRLIVTDFWFDQSLAYAHAGLDHDAEEAVRRHWQQLRAGVLSPKLLVRLLPLGTHLRFPEGSNSIRFAGSSVGMPHWSGPELHVKCPTLEEQLAEVSAAVEAMK